MGEMRSPTHQAVFMNTSGPDTNADSLDPYRIHSDREILSYLDEIRRQRQLVRMVFSQGRESVLTSILDIDADGQAIYIDAAPDPAQNRRIMLTQQVSFETTLDRIRILFTASGAQRCDRAGFPALRFAMPASLARIQRRQSYRVNVPFANPIRCIFMPPGTDMRPLAAPTPVDLLNISIGGIAVIDTGYFLDSRPGAVYPTCQIAFPGYPVTVALEVRHIQVITLPSGKAARHVGLRFVETPNQVIALVQRYIMKLEREQNAKNIGAR
jgi:c-di-GMP-binding flagellar brake protein YcgR